MKKCQVEFPEKTNQSLDKVVDKILTHSQYLDTPEKAVKWLESHKEQLVLSGLGDWADKKGDLVILGIEPGANPGGEYYDKDGKLQRRLAKVKEEDTSDLKDKDWEKWYQTHPLVYANDVRQQLQVHSALEKRGGSDLAPRDATGKLLGREAEKNKKREDFTREAIAARTGKKPYIRKLERMADSSDWNSLMGSNISPFGVPSDKYWPFEKLPFAANSPFKSRDAWMKYASSKMADKFKSEIEKSPRKLVVVGANRKEHKEMFNQVAKDMGGKPRTETLRWKSANGKDMKADVNIFTVEGSNGKTVFVQTNHPSWTGWTNDALSKVSDLVADARK